MELRNKPPNLLSSIHTARNFYLKHKAMPQYEHCMGVLKKAEKHKIVEGKFIKRYTKDPNRALVNSILAETILYHIIDHKKIDGCKYILPAAVNDPAVKKEIVLFGKLTELDRKGAALSEYIPLLNNGEAPLAILAKLADYAVTHNGENHLENFISEEGHPIFRTYSSMAEAYESLRMDANAGERIYAPIAELFGHPELAGSILKHAFDVNHHDIYNFVMEKIKDAELQERLSCTRILVKELAKRIRKTLIGAGFDVVVIPRLMKHEGKIMRKVHRKIAKRYNESEESKSMPFEDYLSTNIESFDITSLNDLVALRVIINKLGKREIDSMEEGKKRIVMNNAMALIKTNIEMLESISGSKYGYLIEDWNKESGYRAIHFDCYPIKTNMLRFEIQLKTFKEHWIAEEGGAAHWIYIGGDSELGRVLKEIYLSIIHRFNGKNEIKEKEGQLELPIPTLSKD